MIERKKECTKCYLLSTSLHINSNRSHCVYFNLRNSSFKLKSVISLKFWYKFKERHIEREETGRD